MPTSRSMLARRAAGVVLLLLVALVASGCKFDGAYDLPLPGNGVARDDAYQVKADFADALNVVPRTEVRANDVVVGRVTDVERVGWHARVTFLVRKDVKLPANLEVDVRQTSLLGEKYIALVEPSGTPKGRLREGAFIPLSRTSRNPEVEEVLGALSMVLSGGGIGQLKTISVELNNMMNGRQDKVRHVLGNLEELIGALDGQKDDIIAAMSSINTLSATLVKEKDVIGEAIDSLGPALKVLNRQHRALITMLKQLDTLSKVGTHVLDASTDNIVSSLRHLQPTLTKLADAGDELPSGLSLLASFPFPKEAESIVRGDYANALFHVEFNLNDILRSPNQNLPDLINLCMTTPLAPACAQLDDTATKVVCGLSKKAAEILCPDGTVGLPNTPTLPSLPGSGSSGSSGGGLGGILGGGSSGSSTGGGSSGGGLGGLLGGGN